MDLHKTQKKTTRANALKSAKSGASTVYAPRALVGYVTDRGRFVRSLDPDVAGLQLIYHELAKLDSFEKGVGTGKGEDVRDKEITEDKSYVTEGGVIPRPFDYELLSQLAERNTTHDAAIERKASDYALHGWKLEVRPECKDVVDADVLDKARREVTNFLKCCTRGDGMLLPIQDLIRDLATDYEKLGTCGFEIIRDSRGFMHHFNHIPFVTMHVLKGKVLEDKNVPNYVQKKYNIRRYFAALGRNVKFGGRKNSKVRFDPGTANFEEFPEYDQREAFMKLSDDFLDCEYLDEETRDPSRAANEFVSICRPPKNASTVYGSPAAVSAWKAMIGEMLSDEYNINYFTAKGIPQYAVIIKGIQSSVDGTIDHNAVAAATKEIEEFFSKHIQNVDRPVLLLGTTGGAEFEFHKLSPENVDEAFSIKYPDRCRDRTRMAHRMPPAALGIIETAQLGAGSSSHQMRDYRTHTVSPGQRIFAAIVDLIIRHGLLIPYFNFVFDEMPIEDEQLARKFHLDEYEKGAITPNEYREETGRAPYTSAEGLEDIGDSLIIRTSQVAILNPDGDVIDTTSPGESVGAAGRVNQPIVGE